MGAATPELRTVVMIVVEVSWLDGGGVWQTEVGRIEDKSAGGACIRLKKPVAAGTKLRIESRFEQFAAVVCYCRTEARDFVIGVQRKNGLIVEAPSPKVLSKPGEGAIELAETRSSSVQKKKDMQRSAEAAAPPRLRDPTVSGSVEGIPAQGRRERYVRDWRRTARRNSASAAARGETRTVELSAESESGRKNKPMKRKWLDLAPWGTKEGGNKESGNSHESRAAGEKAGMTGKLVAGEMPTAATEKNNLMFRASHSSEKAASREVPNFQVELLPVEDVFLLAGIANPQRGYSVSKVIEMINSEHIRTLSKEMKRAAVLMALDAAGISVEQIQRDAKARQDALDAYEASQKKQAEAEWGRKAEEIIQIQSELESIKAHYTARIGRCTEALSRDKARFSSWVTAKEQESRDMAEAVELCLKSTAEAAVSASPAMAAAGSAGSASAKLQ